MKSRKYGIVLAAIVLTSAVTALTTLRGQQQPADKGRQPEDEHPAVDFTKGSAQSEKRSAKGRRYDNSGVVENGAGLQAVTLFNDWSFRVTELPAGASGLVVVGRVGDAQTFLSPDGRGVYTEYQVRVDEVLKDSAASVAAGDTIAVDRVGGRVRYPSGDIVTYAVEGQGVLRGGRRYLLFLERTEENLSVMTGYELQGKKVRPLDHAQKFKKFEGVDEDAFLNQVRAAAAPPAPGTSD
jgi:hypothetical protein